MKKLLTCAVLSLLLLPGCKVTKEEEGELPSASVDYKEGNLPEYEVKKTKEGNMPEVEVEADAGKLPEYDAEMGELDVDIEKKTVEVPVPDVDVEYDEE